MFKMDPEYPGVDNVSNNQDKEVHESKSAQEAKAKIRAIVDRELQAAIHNKEKELFTIDQRLTEARCCLALLRRGAVQTYYSSTQPRQTANNPDVSFHPAIRGTFGGKRPRQEEESAKKGVEVMEGGSEIKSEEDSENEAKHVRQNTKSEKDREEEKPKEESTEEVVKNELPEVIPRYIPPRQPVSEFAPLTPRGSQNKFLQRIVVGNVSRWIPEAEREGGGHSHKWMVYVRGSRDSPDLSAVVEKVRFELHPSYQPHHIVEIAEPPFHLTRRGWGEFPVRVTLMFVSPLDKPVTLEHRLKLDRTCTGLQTLGRETELDVWLHNQTPEGASEGVDCLFQAVESEGWVIKHTGDESLRPTAS